MLHETCYTTTSVFFTHTKGLDICPTVPSFPWPLSPESHFALNLLQVFYVLIFCHGKCSCVTESSIIFTSWRCPLIVYVNFSDLSLLCLSADADTVCFIRSAAGQSNVRQSLSLCVALSTNRCSPTRLACVLMKSHDQNFRFKNWNCNNIGIVDKHIPV